MYGEPDRFMRHYCRICDFFADAVPNGQTPSPHTLTVMHCRTAHAFTGTQNTCSRRCAEREQPEEKKQKRRIYGPGAVALIPLRRYELLFPEDDQ